MGCRRERYQSGVRERNRYATANALGTGGANASLSQQRVRLEVGVGWWQQIKDGLDQMEFMILVTSEATVYVVSAFPEQTQTAGDGPLRPRTERGRRHRDER